MDIKSIIRVFRYGQLQAKSDADPAAHRPPTIKFLGVFIALAVVAILAGLVAWGSGQIQSAERGGALTAPDENGNMAGNQTTTPTSPSPTPTIMAAGIGLRPPS